MGRRCSAVMLAALTLVLGACAGTTVGAGPDGAMAVDGTMPDQGVDDSLPFDDSDESSGDDEDADVGEATDSGSEAAQSPGSGTEVRMARADWSSGFMQAEIYAQLLEELGYTVDRGPTLDPATFYTDLAEGDFDFWANSWPIVHDEFLAATTPDGTVIGDVVRYIGDEMPLGGLQGFLVDIATADANGITRLDQIATDPAITALFDSDGDGRAELAGCDAGWGCEAVIDQLIETNGWTETLEQVKGSHSELFAEQVARFEAGEPVLAYVWTPGPFITQLQPGVDVYWLGVTNPIAGQDAAAALPAGQCPADPCTMGFSPSDIKVTARNDFLDQNPAAASLFEQVQIGVLDVSFQNLEMLEGANTESDIAEDAAEWIDSNRSDVDRWLTIARGAG